jgi:hypothetical protein
MIPPKIKNGIIQMGKEVIRLMKGISFEKTAVITLSSVKNLRTSFITLYNKS